MASGAFILPNKSKLNLFNATDLLGANAANFKLALIGSGWTPDNSDTGNELFADASANEIAGGGGYTAGGIALTGVVLSQSGGTVKFTSNSAMWTATGSGIPAWRRGLVYYVGTLNGKVNPILAHFLGDSTAVDVPLTAAPNTLTFTPNASGIITAS